MENPVEELDRFVAHYSKTGWLDANGNRIRDKVAAMKSWAPAKDAKRLPGGVVNTWRKARKAK